MSELPLPERPRLSAGIHARRHVVDGVERVILHGWRTGAVLEIEPDSWVALTQADGTRDLDALCLACVREGVFESEADLVALLSELNAAGVLEDGLAAPAPTAPVEMPRTPPERPLEPLPGFTLRCDGGGSCCRFYGSVLFEPLEALRAQVVASGLKLPLVGAEAFTPLRGAQPDRDGFAVAQVDGRCVFLGEDARCELHRHGGPEAKPLPCRLYPSILMDDGVTVRASLVPECACAFASVGRTDGEPLVPAVATIGALSLDHGVMQVPDPVPITSRRSAPRPLMHDWTGRLVAVLDPSAPPPAVDAAWLVFELARRLDDESPSLASLDDALLGPLRSAFAPADDVADRWLTQLAEHAARGAATQASWRSASDLSRRVATWLAEAIDGVAAADLLAAPVDAAAEQFYLRALAHGHRLAVEGRPLVHGLRDRGTRILAARAMAAVSPPPDTSNRYPLALLEAAARNLGLGRYADGL